MRAIFLSLLLAAPLAQADELFTKIDPAPRSEFWLDTGFATAHFDSDKDLNGANKGLGAEYRFSGTMSATAGRFYNSDRAWSNYAGVIWQPYAVGPVRVGLALAAFDGYPNMRSGGWFPAAIPTLSYEYKRVGVNIGIIPTYKDRLYGGVSFQLKFKLFEQAR
ncbi:hypothetical protein LK542_17000 [Massilia sp. IC2-477]|uniref:hypothetical protein n=1 Tax=Massilia sp. IC2-477 TaxID=2887198 RepID=UPI001D121C23|nr:hypothetical protein [Massilia sp. IC2-477]MCC2957315.1 hypothetical protein [Massilia sp. IC2-477]